MKHYTITVMDQKYKVIETYHIPKGSIYEIKIENHSFVDWPEDDGPE
jgi:hypothetical protein